VCREIGAVTSLDGGGLRDNTMELLEYIDVAICAERLAEQLNVTDAGLLDILKSKGVKIGGVTRGERGMVWYDETGEIKYQPPLVVPSAAIIDTSGAGDIFHGAYFYSRLAYPDEPWEKHFDFARAAAAHKIQKLGNEAGLPSLRDIQIIQNDFKVAA
jgi:sugar/nucleoside kinase (ribokinase family)